MDNQKTPIPTAEPIAIWIVVHDEFGRDTKIRFDQVDAMHNHPTSAEWGGSRCGTSTILRFRSGKAMRVIENMKRIEQLVSEQLQIR